MPNRKRKRKPPASSISNAVAAELRLAPLPTGDLLTPEQTAQRLGVKVQTLALWRHYKSVRLPFFKLGPRLVRYSPEAVDAFLAAATVSPAAI